MTGPADGTLSVDRTLPDWLDGLAGAAGSIDGLDLSRFLPPADGSGRPSAVLIAFTEGPQGPSVLLLQRASSLREHAGQVAFPGGSLDPGDDGPVGAALREANEEVGLDPASVHVVAELPPIYIPVSGFIVTPVLAWWPRPHPIGPGDAAEVARVAIVALAELADPANRFTVAHPSGFTGPGFEAQGLFVWGFTAGLLDRLMRIAGWERPWDPARRRELPATPDAPVADGAGADDVGIDDAGADDADTDDAGADEANSTMRRG